MGKTTFLRELARLLSSGSSRVVVIVDKSMEIAGTGIVPHDAIGNARVLTVERPELQVGSLADEGGVPWAEGALTI